MFAEERNQPSTRDRVIIFDTTLRDGEQSPGASMNLAEKVRIAHELSNMGVDVIEAGFPIASPGDFEAVQAVAREVGHRTTIAGLCRCQKPDIDRAWEALQDARHKRLHVFLATSKIHRDFKLNMAKETIIHHTVAGVSMAREYCDDVEFSAEDAARTEPEFLAEVVERAIDAGATTVNIPDTVGYAMPEQYGRLIAYLKQHVRNINRAVISVHCHNDLGMAVANSLAAVQNGARQVECTVNGIGERAGNASLEEVVMAIRTRNDIFPFETGINTRRLFPISRLVSETTGLQVQRNKAVVGRNAFAHEAGIHQHGMLKNQSTYEIMNPEDVGVDGSELVLGKHSGRHAFINWAEANGFFLEPDAVERAFAAFKVLADEKKDVTDEDLFRLLSEGRTAGEWEVHSVFTTIGTGASTTASVSLRHQNGHIVEEAACGTEQIDALFKAIRRIVDVPVDLIGYQCSGKVRGSAPQSEVEVEIGYANRTHRARVVDTNIALAGARALLSAIPARAYQIHAVPAPSVLETMPAAGV